MQNPIYNDQAYIAEKFLMEDDLVQETSVLAVHRIQSYKLSLQRVRLGVSPEFLKASLEKSFFRYRDAYSVLQNVGFFDEIYEN